MDPAGSSQTKELVVLWRRDGGENVARAIVEALYPQVIRIVRNHLPFRADEEDLAQEVFAKLFASFERYDASRPLENWVSRVTVNVCRDQLRRRACRPEVRWADLREDTQRVIEMVQGAVETPTELAEDAREILQKLLETLPADDRIVLSLLYVEEKSTAEIAEVLGWSRVLVKVRAFRARARLKKALEAMRPEKKSPASVTGDFVVRKEVLKVHYHE